MYFTLSTYKQSSEGKGCVQVSQDVKGQEPLEPSHPAPAIPVSQHHRRPRHNVPSSTPTLLHGQVYL